MSIMLKKAVTEPCAWRGEDLIDDDSWCYHLTDSDIAALETGLRHVTANRHSIPDFTASHFPVGGFAEKLANLADILETGRGFLLMRGLPIDRYTDDEIRILYYGIGLHLGTPVTQNPAGDMLGVVMNVGDLSDRNTRVYQTNAYLPYHTDPSDVVGLLCLRQAKFGGLSSLVSSASVYNELLSRYPEYLSVFYRPTYYAHLGPDLPKRSSIYSYHAGKLSCRYLRQYIELGNELRGAPLSRIEIEAFDIFDSITQDPSLKLDMMLEPGDIQWANNYVCMHSRTEFEDHDNPGDRRKMLRLWIKMPQARDLAPDFPGRNGFSNLD